VAQGNGGGTVSLFLFLPGRVHEEAREEREEGGVVMGTLLSTLAGAFREFVLWREEPTERLLLLLSDAKGELRLGLGQISCTSIKEGFIPGLWSERERLRFGDRREGVGVSLEVPQRRESVRSNSSVAGIDSSLELSIRRVKSL